MSQAKKGTAYELAFRLAKEMERRNVRDSDALGTKQAIDEGTGTTEGQGGSLVPPHKR